jgi:hypothetical protein
MNIIFDVENINELKNNNIVLELDTFYISSLDKSVTAYCVIEHVNIMDFDKLPQAQKLHDELIAAYKSKDFKLCNDLLEVLAGSFNGEMDSFYQELSSRLCNLQSQVLPQDWSSAIAR